ncbi:hypothetical protein DAEQUDRAFT_185819 [Daedalea quercina L-15889]|uniref:Uncharacterized protein n=1 Tax=Daedalea quercina L-15889 TaxID=1314783 RepID=A0A165KHY8_9APHY|nr:hypothetical protein DAEQUDRAFT_185819 [Daedalea quercina L-15889]
MLPLKTPEDFTYLRDINCYRGVCCPDSVSQRFYAATEHELADDHYCYVRHVLDDPGREATYRQDLSAIPPRADSALDTLLDSQPGPESRYQITPCQTSTAGIPRVDLIIEVSPESEPRGEHRRPSTHVSASSSSSTHGTPDERGVYAQTSGVRDHRENELRTVMTRAILDVLRDPQTWSSFLPGINARSIHRQIYIGGKVESEGTLLDLIHSDSVVIMSLHVGSEFFHVPQYPVSAVVESKEDVVQPAVGERVISVEVRCNVQF